MTGEFLDRLDTDDYLELVDTLYAMGGVKDLNSPPSDAEVKKLCSMLYHPDEDIRERVVFILGLHWRIKEFYPLLVDMLRNHKEKDEFVLGCVCRSISAMYTHGTGFVPLKEASELLAEIVLDISLNSDLRGNAYLCLKRINSDPNVWHKVKVMGNIEEVDYDETWTKSFLK